MLHELKQVSRNVGLNINRAKTFLHIQYPFTLGGTELELVSETLYLVQIIFFENRMS